MADHGEALARCTAEDAIDGSIAYLGGFPDLVAGEFLNGTCEH